MALINCVECGNQFSDRAQACPKCGCPLGPPLAQAATPVNVNVTGFEFTAKWIKALSFLCSVGFVVGLILIILSKGEPGLVNWAGILVFIGSVLAGFVVGTIQWWHHG